MKRLKKYFIILIAAIFPLFLSAQNTETEITSSGDAKSDTLSFTIYGMDCPGCEGGLEKQVNKIPAIKYSEANWVEQELKIVVKEDEELDMKELKKRVKKANFTLVDKPEKKDDEE